MTNFAGHPPSTRGGPGFVVLYRWRLHPGRELQFVDAWSSHTAAFLQAGSLGSRLHRAADGVWYSYAQWPSAEARASAFVNAPLDSHAVQQMRDAVAESLPELVLEVVADFIGMPQATAAPARPPPSSPSPPTNAAHGLLLFAHGARDPNWALPFEAVAARLQTHSPATPVRLAFLEFMTPGLVDAGSQLAAAGCRRVDVVPLFLGAGGHVRKDLPLLLDRLRGAHPGVDWRLRPAIGEVDAVVDAMADAALAALHPAA